MFPKSSILTQTMPRNQVIKIQVKTLKTVFDRQEYRTINLSWRSTETEIRVQILQVQERTLICPFLHRSTLRCENDLDFESLFFSVSCIIQTDIQQLSLLLDLQRLKFISLPQKLTEEAYFERLNTISTSQIRLERILRVLKRRLHHESSKV